MTIIQYADNLSVMMKFIQRRGVTMKNTERIESLEKRMDELETQFQELPKHKPATKDEIIQGIKEGITTQFLTIHDTD